MTTREQLLSWIEPTFKERGWRRAPGPPGSFGVVNFYRCFDDLFGVVQVEFSGLYWERFTGSLSLGRTIGSSKSLHRSGTLDGSGKRISELLRLDERENAGAVDATSDLWWSPFSTEAADSFASLAMIAADRQFSGRTLEKYAEAVRTQPEGQSHFERVSGIAQRGLDLGAQPPGLIAQPKKPLPPDWAPFYWVAELDLAETTPPVRKSDKQHVAIMGRDALQYALSERPCGRGATD